MGRAIGVGGSRQARERLELSIRSWIGAGDISLCSLIDTRKEIQSEGDVCMYRVTCTYMSLFCQLRGREAAKSL